MNVWIEMESNRELEMDGIASDVRVHDIFHPTPVPLKDLSAIAVSLEIWRCKTNEYRDNCKLKEFCPSGEPILLKQMLPYLPSVIYTAIDKYVRRFGRSMENWLKEHHKRIFYFYYYHQNSVLEHFDEFVCDYTGAVDYVRTAERMMHCHPFDENRKFMIACTYFFEDDIRRLWPLVSRSMDLNTMDFSNSPQLYYWICCLRNELNKIPSNEVNISVDEVMFEVNMPQNGPSLQYFWNRMPLQNRMRRALGIFTRDKLSFARFILPNLDDQQLEEFVNERSHKLMSNLFENVWCDKELVLLAWMHIRKAISVDGFTKLAVKMLQNELKVFPVETTTDTDRESRIQFDLCCEIWISSPENLKRSAVVEIISNKRLFSNLVARVSNTEEIGFLPIFLSDATSAERSRFWFDCWEDLVESARCKDLAKIMKLCFENEHDRTQFKENIMANSRRVHCFCSMLLQWLCFDQLNNFASFLWSDVQRARSFKQQILRSTFLGSNDTIIDRTFRETKELNKFIEDAFANAELSTDFKNQLMSLPEIQRSLSQLSLYVPFELLVEFIDTFVSLETTLLEMKARIIDELKERAANCKSSRCEFYHTPLLLWCLGSQEEVAKFKENYL
ncbi:uncharacterized protein LOC135849444 isoform X2 [Planococcus citri]|uniref:uncharacterized protein LOC135849444 isoform X2 n=1 Tax=Planococcus citri TaxID=170843 RepID=UPI0031F8E26D